MAAIRQEELRQEELRVPDGGALVYDFPTVAVRRRVARQERIAHVRRRIAAAALVLLVLAGGGTVARNAVGHTPVSSRAGAPQEVSFRSGMTLWEVAETYAAPGSDPRAYVSALLELNDLPGPPRPGARIKLPRSS